MAVLHHIHVKHYSTTNLDSRYAHLKVGVVCTSTHPTGVIGLVDTNTSMLFDPLLKLDTYHNVQQHFKLIQLITAVLSGKYSHSFMQALFINIPYTAPALLMYRNKTYVFRYDRASHEMSAHIEQTPVVTLAAQSQIIADANAILIMCLVQSFSSETLREKLHTLLLRYQAAMLVDAEYERLTLDKPTSDAV